MPRRSPVLRDYHEITKLFHHKIPLTQKASMELESSQLHITLIKVMVTPEYDGVSYVVLYSYYSYYIAIIIIDI